MPESLADVWFWNYRGRKHWQAHGFGTIVAGDAGIAGKATVLGSPRPEVLAGVWFWDHRGRRYRNCLQGFGFGTTEAGSAGRNTVLGPP